MDSQAGSTQQTTSFWGALFRDQLAAIVVITAGVGISIISYVLVSDQQAEFGTRKEIFNILVPVLSTWVGTVLAFYFSKENFAAANSSVREVVSKLAATDGTQNASVRQVMKPRNAIKGIVIADGKGDDSVSSTQLGDIFNLGATRVVVFNAGDSVKYVIHDGTWDKYVSRMALSVPGFKPADVTLADLVAFSFGDQVVGNLVRKIAFVGLNATLADARDAMLAVKGAQDVFLTRSGRAEEPVEGWLTNSDLARTL